VTVTAIEFPSEQYPERRRLGVAKRKARLYFLRYGGLDACGTLPEDLLERPTRRRDIYATRTFKMLVDIYYRAPRMPV